MKIGKLKVQKVTHPTLGVIYEISASNTKTKEVVVIGDETAMIRVSLNTAKKLARLLK